MKAFRGGLLMTVAVVGALILFVVRGYLHAWG